MLFYVRYQAEAGTWELGHPVDEYFAAYPARRDSIVALANEHRDSMGRDELVRFLIQAAIATGINKRVGILDTVELAANLEAVQRSIDTDAEYTSIPTEFDAAFIAATLDRGRGTRGGRGLWWVDDGKLYRLY